MAERGEEETDGLALLKRRDDAWEYFQTHSGDYGAMASWEAADDDLRKFLRAASTSPRSERDA